MVGRVVAQSPAMTLAHTWGFTYAQLEGYNIKPQPLAWFNSLPTTGRSLAQRRESIAQWLGANTGLPLNISGPVQCSSPISTVLFLKMI